MHAFYTRRLLVNYVSREKDPFGVYSWKNDIISKIFSSAFILHRVVDDHFNKGSALLEQLSGKFFWFLLAAKESFCWSICTYSDAAFWAYTYLGFSSSSAPLYAHCSAKASPMICWSWLRCKYQFVLIYFCRCEVLFASPPDSYAEVNRC